MIQRIRPVLIAASLALLLLSPLPVLGVDGPPGFIVENAFPEAQFVVPVEFAVLPDGRVLVATKIGVIHVIETDGSVVDTPFLEIDDITTSGDLGLLGLAVSPDFEVNPWVYVAYTVDPTPGPDFDFYSRVERVRPQMFQPNRADLTTRQVLLGATWPEGPPSLDSSHGLGALRFGEDGSLFVAHGDGAHFQFTDRGGEDPGAFGKDRTDPEEDIGAFRARSIHSFSGGVLRIDPETGHGLPSNPYWDGDGDSFASRVWCYGLRNPFRFSVRPGSGAGTGTDAFPGVLYIGDVGWQTWEEFVIARSPGQNFGWPCFEGPLPQSRYQNVIETATGNTDVLCDSGPNGTNPALDTPPRLWWHHSDASLSFPRGYRARSVTGGSFAGADNWPDEYRDAYFIGDFLDGWILAVRVDEHDQIVKTHSFLSSVQGPVSLQPDPSTGDLLYLSLTLGQIHRVRFDETASAVSHPADPTGGINSLAVTAEPNPTSSDVRLVLESEMNSAPYTLRILGPTGRIIRTLNFADPASGVDITWDGTDGSGEQVPAGVYFAHVTRGGRQGSTKITVR